jgi:hypothetical protein
MNDDLSNQIYNNLNLRETDELLEIWQTNDHVEWTDIAFDVIQEILKNRQEELPLQNEPIVEHLEELPSEDRPDDENFEEDVDDESSNNEKKLEELLEKGDVSGLVNMLENETDWMLCLIMAEALAELGDERGLDYLIAGLDIPDKDVNSTAREILAELNNPRGNLALNSSQSGEAGLPDLQEVLLAEADIDQDLTKEKVVNPDLSFPSFDRKDNRKCEKCASLRPAQIYRFYYGNETEPAGGYGIFQIFATPQYNVAGQESVTICNKCVLEQSVTPIGIRDFRATMLLFILVLAAWLNISKEGGWFWFLVAATIFLIGFLDIYKKYRNSRAVKENNESAIAETTQNNVDGFKDKAERIAITLREDELVQRGYTRFFPATRYERLGR